MWMSGEPETHPNATLEWRVQRLTRNPGGVPDSVLGQNGNPYDFPHPLLTSLLIPEPISPNSTYLLTAALCSCVCANKNPVGFHVGAGHATALATTAPVVEVPTREFAALAVRRHSSRFNSTNFVRDILQSDIRTLVSVAEDVSIKTSLLPLTLAELKLSLPLLPLGPSDLKQEPVLCLGI